MEFEFSSSSETPADTVPIINVRHVPNIVEFTRIFMEQAHKFFEDQEAINKLTILKQANLDEIINTLKNWDNINKKLPLQYKWRKRYFIIFYY